MASRACVHSVLAGAAVVALAGAGAWPASAAGAAGAGRFQVSVGGDEVHDSRSGLVWQRCVEGMRAQGDRCIGDERVFDHASALRIASDRAASDGVPWRLATAVELSSISATIAPHHAPIDARAFPSIPPGLFWSSDTLGAQAQAVDVHTAHASAADRARAFHVRLVRTLSPAT
jgi:hypothetical protein